MKVTIGGSYRKHWKEIKELANKLRSTGIEVLSPKENVEPINERSRFY